VRGQYATKQKVPVRELVVGDLVVLQQGDLVPADCLLIDEDDITVDESKYNPEHKKDYRQMQKELSLTVEQQIEQNPDPCLLYGTSIVTGHGKAIVLAVGKKMRYEVDKLHHNTLELKETKL
jgi:magnesium-transporting ATPase (P-type)